MLLLYTLWNDFPLAVAFFCFWNTPLAELCHFDHKVLQRIGPSSIFFRDFSILSSLKFSSGTINWVSVSVKLNAASNVFQQLQKACQLFRNPPLPTSRTYSSYNFCSFTFRRWSSHILNVTLISITCECIMRIAIKVTLQRLTNKKRQ